MEIRGRREHFSAFFNQINYALRGRRFTGKRHITEIIKIVNENSKAVTWHARDLITHSGDQYGSLGASKELKEGSKFINSVTNLVTGTNSLEEIKFECFHFLKT